MKKLGIIVIAALCLASCDTLFPFETRTTEEILADNAGIYGFHFDNNGVVVPGNFEPAGDSVFYAIFSGTSWVNTYTLEIDRSCNIATVDYYKDVETNCKGVGRVHFSVEKDSTFYRYFYDYDTKESCFSHKDIEFVSGYGGFRAEGSDLPYEHLLLAVNDRNLETVDCLGKRGNDYIFCYAVYTFYNEELQGSLKKQFTVER